jgi:uncharacterized membrane protein YhiD involved in acid resistance
LTTAATLWFATVLGLCFGGGQLALGLAVLALGVLVLGGLKRLENRWKQDRHATLSLTVIFVDQGRAVRMLYDFLVVRQITPSNPAHSVRGPKYVIKKGKTPVWSREDAKTLLD